MIQIDKALLDDLFEKAKESDRLRMNYDLRTSTSDNSQRMLNALLPGTVVSVHRHPQSNENVILLCGRLDVVIYSAEGKEIDRFYLDPSAGSFGCVIPAGAWHTVDVMEPSVIYEAKDGSYGQDGSVALEEYKAKKAQPVPPTSAPESCFGDLKKQITYLIGMERQSGSMEVCSPLYVARMLGVPVEEVEKVLKEMQL